MTATTDDVGELKAYLRTVNATREETLEVKRAARAVRMARAGRALTALGDALGGEPPPCAAQPDLWFSDAPGDRRAAAQGCRECPVQRECRTYATTLRPASGIWGGQLRSRKINGTTTPQEEAPDV